MKLSQANIYFILKVTRPESFEILKSNNPIFFIYIGKQAGNLWNSYYIASENNQAHGYFYATTLEVASKHFFIDSTPMILVYKENTHYTFPLSDSHDIIDPIQLNSTLHNWVCQEKFLTFPRVTRDNIYQLKQTKKYLVLAVVEENKLNELVTHELEFRDMIEQIIRTKRSKYHDNFQFGWIGNPELSHSIAADNLNTPHLLVINSTTNEHHLPDDDPLEMTPESVEMFLETVFNQTAQTLGGDFFTVRTYRAWFELKRLLRDMWKGNPVLSCGKRKLEMSILHKLLFISLSVIFGLPLGFLSLICYSIFCADILDADPEEDDGHEKKE